MKLSANFKLHGALAQDDPRAFQNLSDRLPHKFILPLQLELEASEARELSAHVACSGCARPGQRLSSAAQQSHARSAAAHGPHNRWLRSGYRSRFSLRDPHEQSPKSWMNELLSPAWRAPAGRETRTRSAMLRKPALESFSDSVRTEARCSSNSVARLNWLPCFVSAAHYGQAGVNVISVGPRAPS